MSLTIRRERDRASFRASRMGPLAARALAVPRKGAIVAVFDRSIYCLLGGEYVCLGGESLGMGPLTVTLEVPAARWHSLRFRTSLPVTLSPGKMEIGTEISLDLGHARTWSPPPVPRFGCGDVRKGLRVLEEAAAGLVPREGLGRFLFVDPKAGFPPDRVSSHAEKPVESLKRRLSDRPGREGSRGAAEGSDWQLLLGLGPGLTPSGDDFLGGMMLALHGLGETRLLRSLSQSVEEAIPGRTGPISEAYLRAAMQGIGNEILHDVLGAVLSGGAGSEFHGLAKAVGKIGHTSGWDAVAGMAVTCRLWTESVSETKSVAR